MREEILVMIIVVVKVNKEAKWKEKITLKTVTIK